MPSCLLRTVITSAIVEHSGVLPPSRRLTVELGAELREEEAEHVRVRVTLGQGEPHPSVRVDGREDG